ncbi:hypothetical protein CLI74_05115 [Porphyromonas gingivalis]|nr:hypothetical protein CLI74_05115 [Porphyromonas gingivalis]
MKTNMNCCMGVSLSSFAAEQILSVFGKGQTSGIWTSSKQKFPQVSFRGGYLRFAETHMKHSFFRQINACADR